MMKKIFFTMITMVKVILTGQTFTVTQIPSTSAANLKALINSKLLGQGISVVGNPTYSGNIKQIGSFNNAPTGFKMSNGGLLLSSGDITDIAGSPSSPSTIFNSNPNSDLSINAIVQKFLSSPYFSAPAACSSGGFANCGFDKSVLEFDFTACGDTVSFNYLFASSEYALYTCSQFTDFFGFFISGPNPNGGLYTNQNVAIIPKDTNFILYDSLPVMINSINSGIATGGSSSQCASLAYANLFNGSPQPGFAFDKKTLKLKTKPIKIFPGQVYHIKIAIQDIGDAFFDSGVLLEAGSFSTSEPPEINSITTIGNNPSAIFEGCGEHRISIKRKTNLTKIDTVFINYRPFPNSTVSLVPGVDLLSLPSMAIFPINTDSVVITYKAVIDNLTELPSEKLDFYFKIKNCVGSYDSVDYVLRVFDPAKVENLIPPVNIVDSCPNKFFNLSMSFTSKATNGLTGASTLKYVWTLNGLVVGTTKSIIVSPPSPGVYKYYCTAKDTCNNSAIDSITISRRLYVPIAASIPILKKDCPKDSIIIKASFTDGIPPYFIRTFENNNEISYFSSGDTLRTSLDTLKFKVGALTTANYKYQVQDNCRIGIPLVIFNNLVKVGDGILPLTSNNLLDSTVICEGVSTLLSIKPKGGVLPYKLKWLPSNAIDSNIIVSPSANTIYTYSWTDRCEVDTLRDTILVKVSKVKADFNTDVPALKSGVDGALGNYNSTNFTNTSATNDGSMSYEWYLNGVKISTDKDFSATMDYDKNNAIKLVTTNSRGCISIIEKPLAEQTFVTVPNVFTPDDDNINARFASINKGVVNYELKIFDCWGALVFESKDPKEGWDGNINGNKANTGTYFIIMKYNEREDGKENKYQGYVQLLR
jgi:gliding motility-associated-like protein